jgi:hypothetical protein
VLGLGVMRGGRGRRTQKNIMNDSVLGIHATVPDE